MCALIKIYQQTFVNDSVSSPTFIKHHFNRVYKDKAEQYFKIKPIFVSTTSPLFMIDFPQINSLCNHDTSDGLFTIESSNHFFLGSISSQYIPEMIVDDISLTDFRIVNEVDTVVADYTLVFQIELWERD